MTWSAFLSHGGEYASSAIWEAHSDDGGQHWSPAKAISGSNAAICTFQEDGPAGVCDENQFSVPAVAPDGTVYVAFQNSQNTSLWEPGEVNRQPVPAGQVAPTVVRPGRARAFIVGLEDGSRDYPTQRRTIARR